MSRVIWKGSISFGLVHVPVALHPAEQRDELDLTMLDKRDFSPIGYRRINKSTGEEVASDDIVKGYEYQKGEYVLLGEEDLKRANAEATQTIEIIDFVDAAAIPLIYHDRPYYLEPINRGEKGYALLRETLLRTGKVGVAKVVLRTRQYLAALVPWGDLLVLDLLRYHDELRGSGELKLPGPDLTQLGVSEKELEMAQRLVEGMVEEWQPERYRDEYRDDLMHLIDEKIAAGETHTITPPAPSAPPRKAEVIDLMTQLKRSLEQAKRGRTPQEKEAAPRRRPGKRQA